MKRFNKGHVNKGGGDGSNYCTVMVEWVVKGGGCKGGGEGGGSGGEIV